MADDLALDRTPLEPAGTVVRLSPLVRRLVAGNGGPMTFTGTCSYIVGNGTVAIVDPGPEDAAQHAALLAAVAGETVSHIVVTHTHRDHSPGARALAAATGAPIVGCAPHRASRILTAGETARLDAAFDPAHAPDAVLAHGEGVTGPGWSLVALATPGHTANHLAFALPEENSLFSGDHVMAWSTTVIAPPDGAMADYMASVESLRRRDDALYWPGHGGPVREPQRFLRGLVHHRRQREAAILNRLRAGDSLIAEMVPPIYQGLPQALHGAAALSVLAQLEWLVEQGQVVCDEAPPALASRYALP